MLFEQNPSVVGHRGLGRGEVSGHWENTVSSLVAAAEAGVDWLELDVTRSGDGVLVVHHNPSTADGAFLVDQTAAELGTKGVPTLAEALDALPPDLPVNLDVKTVLEDAPLPADAGTMALLAPALAREVARRPLLVTSFDPAALLTLRAEVPRVAYGLISWIDFPLRIAVSAAAHLGMQVLCAHHGSFGPNRIEPPHVHRDPAYTVSICHEAGLEVLAWSPMDDAARGLVEAGVDAVCVNDVPRMLPLVRSWTAAS